LLIIATERFIKAVPGRRLRKERFRILAVFLLATFPAVAEEAERPETYLESDCRYVMRSDARDLIHLANSSTRKRWRITA
jgi:hypothetical protein